MQVLTLFSQIYENFISIFEARLDQVRLASLLALVGNTLRNPQESLTFFERVLTARARLGAEAALCLDMDVIMAKIKLGNLSEIKFQLDESKEVLSTIRSTESVAFSKFYRASAEYRKVS